MNPTEYLITVYDPIEIFGNLGLSCVLGLIISLIYKKTHTGLSYSQSFLITIIFVTVIVSMVMMVIGNSLARAFALVGALSIIRFRTVIKDTKDTAYVFIALAAGMAAGTSSYLLAISGVSTVSLLALVLHRTQFGRVERGEIILRFRSTTEAASAYQVVLDNYGKRADLLKVDPSEDGDGRSIVLTFDLVLKRESGLSEMISELSSIQGVSEVRAISSKTDIDY